MVGALAAPVADIPVVIRVAFVADAFLDVDHLLAPVSRIPVRPVALLEEQAPPCGMTWLIACTWNEAPSSLARTAHAASVQFAVESDRAA